MNVGNTTKIIAPAGCGKTTRLLEIVDDLLSSGTPADRIVYTTFTRSGAYEALDRACVKFNLNAKQLPYFRTMHSLGYRLMGRREVMKTQDWFQIAKSTGISMSPQRSDLFSDNPMWVQCIRKGDHMLACIVLARNTRQSLEKTYFDFEQRQWFTLKELELFNSTIEEYKTVNGKVDYTDMLEYMLSAKPRLIIDALIVDEAQDLNQLQWDNVHYLGGLAKRVWIAGDDDQAIYSYSGAVPEALIDLPAKLELRTQSYRIPKAVQELSHSIVTKLSKRIEKEITPRDAVGKVTHNFPLENLDMTKGNWMCLARNRKYFTNFEELCLRNGWLFETDGTKGPFDMKIYHMVQKWEEFRETGITTTGELADIVRLMPIGRHYKKGFIKMLKEFHPDTEMDATQASRMGLLNRLGWEEQLQKLSRTDKRHIKALLKTGETVPRIHISTIHGVKGREADHVAILPDMGSLTWASYQSDPDPEHRLFYVGVTRAKETLTLLEPLTPRHYTYTY